MTNLIMVGGMFVLCSFWMSSEMSTVSKAFVMSSAVMIVRLGGFSVLNLVMIVLLTPRSTESVECPALKPCWKASCGMFFVMHGSMIFSSGFAMGERSEIGR